MDLASILGSSPSSSTAFCRGLHFLRHHRDWPLHGRTRRFGEERRKEPAEMKAIVEAMHEADFSAASAATELL